VRRNNNVGFVMYWGSDQREDVGKSGTKEIGFSGPRGLIGRQSVTPKRGRQGVFHQIEEHLKKSFEGKWSTIPVQLQKPGPPAT